MRTDRNDLEITRLIHTFHSNTRTTVFLFPVKNLVKMFFSKCGQHWHPSLYVASVCYQISTFYCWKICDQKCYSLPHYISFAVRFNLFTAWNQ